MSDRLPPNVILMADDDVDDCLLMKDALDETGAHYDLRLVGDGEELLDYLNAAGRYAQPDAAPRPDLILLDLRMPRKDGREALKEIKSDPRWRRTPVVVFTTSTADDDVRYAYDQGANSYMTKPHTFRSLVDAARLISRYWFELVTRPSGEG